MNCRCFVVLSVLLTAGCGYIVGKATKEAQPLTYVGSITFGDPSIETDRVVVPVGFSGGEWRQNSAIVPHSIDGNVVGPDEIELTVITSVGPGPEATADKLVLPADTAGDYVVYYRDPDGTRHRIGVLKIDG